MTKPDKERSEEGREALTEKLRKLLDRLEKPEKTESKLNKFANSAFGVAVLAGVILAVVGWGLQTMTAHHDREMQEAKQEQESKEKVAFDFASSFPKSLDLVSRFRPRKLWLNEQQGKQEREHYVDGRSYEETRDYYESCLDKYFAAPPVASAYNQIIASFTNPAVSAAAANLLSNFNAMLNAADTNEVHARFGECNDAYVTLTKDMFQEVLKRK